MTKLEELKAAFEASTPGEWKPCRAHEDFDGAYFDIDPDERAAYEARPFIAIRSAAGTVTTAHDLFTLKNQDANFIALAHNLMPALLEAVALLPDLVQYAEDATLEGDALPSYVVAANELMEKLK